MMLWKLKEVMTEHNISSTELGEKVGVTQSSISKLRKEKVPAFSDDKWNKLLISLNELRKPQTDIIRMTDLVEFICSPEELKEHDICRSDNEILYLKHRNTLKPQELFELEKQ